MTTVLKGTSLPGEHRRTDLTSSSMPLLSGHVITFKTQSNTSRSLVGLPIGAVRLLVERNLIGRLWSVKLSDSESDNRELEAAYAEYDDESFLMACESFVAGAEAWRDE